MRIGLLFLILLIPSATLAQTVTATCSSTNPCAGVPVINTNPLPSTVVLLSCMGSTTTCSQASLTTYLAAQTPTNLCPATSSTWNCISFSQTKSTQQYNDPEPYGALMNYAVQGVTGGGVSANSPITIFQMPAAPTQVPSLGSPLLVTTGSSGPQ